MNTNNINRYKKQNNSQKFKSRVLFWTVAALLIVVVVILIFRQSRLYNARECLTSAKVVRLSIQAAAYDYYAEGNTIECLSSRNGLTDGVEQAVLTLSGCHGNIVYTDFDSKKMHLNELVYVEGNYCAQYKDTGQEQKWNVYFLDHLIKH